jgi:hypothetical protein
MEYFGYYPQFSVLTGEVRHGLELTKNDRIPTTCPAKAAFCDVRGAKLMGGGSGAN